jgi:hypothetical protein
MPLRRSAFIVLACLLGACASPTIVPTYDTSNPNIHVGGPRPDDVPPAVERAGSFCLQVSEKWHQDGKTPDGKALWSKDTFRKVVPCE